MEENMAASNYANIPNLIDGCYTCLESLETKGTRWGRNFHYTRPALTKYSPCQWLWDSGWHSIVWSHREPDNAVAELRTLLQFQQPNGFIPQITFWKPRGLIRSLFDLFAGNPHSEYNDLTQMPMLAYSARAIWNATHNVTLLQEFVPKLIQYMEWWEQRDHDGDGLVSIIHPWESGIDASPVYDPALHLNHPNSVNLYFNFSRIHYLYHRLRWNEQAVLKGEAFNVEDVGVCSVYADGWGVLSKLAEKFDTRLADKCHGKSEKYQKAVIKKCWDAGGERFVSFYHENGAEKASKAETIQTLLPLLLDDLPVSLKRGLVAKITDPGKFGLPYPVPSVAKSEMQFNPNASLMLWRGPMWPATTWLVMEGLLNHGFTKEATVILNHWTELYAENGIWEYYNPLTGKGLGQKELGMSTIIVDMLKRFEMA